MYGQKNSVKINKVLILFKMGLSGAAHGAKRSLFPKMCHTYPKYETSHSYILPEEYPKII